MSGKSKLKAVNLQTSAVTPRVIAVLADSIGADSIGTILA